MIKESVKDFFFIEIEGKMSLCCRNVYENEVCEKKEAIVNNI